MPKKTKKNDVDLTRMQEELPSHEDIVEALKAADDSEDVPTFIEKLEVALTRVQDAAGVLEDLRDQASSSLEEDES